VILLNLLSIEASFAVCFVLEVEPEAMVIIDFQSTCSESSSTIFVEDRLSAITDRRLSLDFVV
jgi:hypothetical protein